MQEAFAGAPPPGGCDIPMSEETDEGTSGDMEMGFVGSLEPSENDYVAELLIQQLGGSF